MVFSSKRCAFMTIGISTACVGHPEEFGGLWQASGAQQLTVTDESMVLQQNE